MSGIASRRRARLDRWRLKDAAVEAERRWGHGHGARGEWVDDEGDCHTQASLRCRCGSSRIAEDVGLSLSDSGAAWFTGVARCGSVWECPVCAPQKAKERADELSRVLKAWRGQGHAVYLVTLTVRHQWGDDLRELVRGVPKGWTYLRQGRRSAELERWGVRHFVKATEVTYGGNGAHPHLHVLLFTDGELGEPELAQLKDWLWTHWRRWVVDKQKWSEPLRDKAVDVEDCNDNVGAYLTKLGLVDEVVRADTKSARGANRGPWEILRDYAEHKRDEDGRLWSQHCQALRGMRQITWSKPRKASGEKSLRELFPPEEDPQGELAVGNETSVGGMNPEVWDELFASDPAARTRLLWCVENGWWSSVRSLAPGIVVHPPRPVVGAHDPTRIRRYGVQGELDQAELEQLGLSDWWDTTTGIDKRYPAPLIP